MVEANVEPPLAFNLMMIGDGAVGKTSIMKRYVSKKFDQNRLATTGVDFQIVKYKSEVHNRLCKVKIWDTAGQDRYRQLTRSFFRDAEGVIVVFDLTRQDTFINVRDWISNLLKEKEELPVILAGNKLDLCEELDDESER